MTVVLLVAAGWALVACLAAPVVGRLLRRRGEQYPAPPPDRP